jgi:hypothetical protein
MSWVTPQPWNHQDVKFARGRYTGVELAKAGTWRAMDGTVTLTPDDLRAAVTASQHLPSPVLKLGHDGGTFGDDLPAVGRVTNLRVTDGGNTLVGDFTDIPGWLSHILPETWPQRSIEASLDYSDNGRTWPFVLTAVALLGTEWPAVSTLADLRDLYTA